MNTLSPFYKVDMSPIRFSLIEFSSMPPSWNSSLQILFVSEGELQLQANGILHELKAKDLAILSPMEIYSFSGGHGVGAIFEIDITEISTLIPDFALSNLQTLVTGSMHTSYAQHMRELLSDIIRLVISDYRKTLPLEYMSIAIRLLVLLSDYAKEPDQEKNTEKSLPLLKAIAFTAEHFREPISVKDAAAISQFSVPHFSKLFVAFIGSSYTEYVTELRLQEAERLLYTGMNITQIAEYCGFSDYRAFTRAYRKKYKLTPSESRKRILSEKSIETPSSKTVSSFVNQHLNLCLSNLSTDAQPQMRINYVQLPDTSLSGLHQEFTHSWQKSIGGGNAFLLLQSENQQLLRYLQENIGYEHIVLQNLLGDYMQVVSPSEQGELRYYFGNCDSVLDFVLSIGLKPIIQLGFMPSALAKHKPSKHSAMSISFSLPADNAQWQHFISAFLQHLFLRYGKNEVENWEFHLWGKPDSYPMPFGIPDVDEYFEFYFATYQTIKSISTKIPFGSPAFLRDSCVKNDWLKRFFALCKKYKCLPDSLRFNFYPVSFVTAPDCSGLVRNVIQHDANPNTMEELFGQISEFCHKNQLSYPLPELEEWNFSISQQELLHDTCYMAGYIVKNVLACWNKASDITYWVYSDAVSRLQVDNELFCGGYGLFTKGMLCKPSYYAFQLLSKLGNRIVTQGEGYIVTMQGQHVQVLFYNYCHYSTLFANDKSNYLNYSDRYMPFSDQVRKHFSLRLTELPASEYIVTYHRLNREHGSVYDSWLEMGQQPLNTREEYEYLKGISQPFMHKHQIHVSDASYLLSFDLEPFEVMLIEFAPI